MSTLAIVGAGPGLGAATARRFATEGFSIALIARDRSKLDALVARLHRDEVPARGYVADVTDRAALAAALERAAAELGDIEALQYSPVPAGRYLRPVLETSTDDLASALDFSVLGAVTAVGAVLPGMRERGRGTLVFVNGGTSVTPRADLAGTSVAFAGESAYAALLHETLAPEGIHVAQVVIPGRIDPDHPRKNPSAIAETIWTAHERPGPLRRLVADLSDSEY